MKILTGERIGKTAHLRVGTSVAVLDESGRKILLTQRADNGQWCMPGGSMTPGESMIETCQRETLEETGLEVRVCRLIGMYSSPDFILEYVDGNRVQLVEFCYLAERLGGELRLSDETLAVGYFSHEEMDALDVLENHRRIIADVFARSAQVVVD
jgi:ADP-ribose pyrophosphatase YjhB (NUDIX family)